MFEIEYKGGNAVVISTKKTKLVCDPRLSVVGLKDLSVKDAVVVATEDRFAISSDDAALTINGPGEYEVGEFSIKGVAATRHIDTPEARKMATIYRIEVGDVRLGLIGNIDAKLSDDQLEALGMLDMLVVPVGGHGYTLDATAAIYLARSIDVKTIIPVHYADSALKYEVEQDGLESFLSEFNATVEETMKYKVKSASALPTAPTVIKLART